MSDSLDVLERLQDTIVLVHESVKDQLHSHGVIRNGKILHDLVLTCRLVLKPAAFEPYLFDYTFGKKVIDVIVPHVKQLVLDG